MAGAGEVAAVVVERLAGKDWELLRDIRLRALTDTPDAFASSVERESAFSEEAWRSRCEATASFAAFSDRHPVGLVCVLPPGFHEDQAPGEAELVSMWVAPEVRRSGVGRLLVSGAVAFASSLRAVAVRLWVVEGNESAETFYRSVGFVPTSRRQLVPRGPRRFESEMRLPL